MGCPSRVSILPSHCRRLKPEGWIPLELHPNDRVLERISKRAAPAFPDTKVTSVVFPTCLGLKMKADCLRWIGSLLRVRSERTLGRVFCYLSNSPRRLKKSFTLRISLISSKHIVRTHGADEPRACKKLAEPLPGVFHVFSGRGK